MLGYLSLDIICSSKLTVFLELSENCSLLGTDNVRGQISEHIFAPNEGYCLYIPYTLIWKLIASSVAKLETDWLKFPSVQAVIIWWKFNKTILSFALVRYLQEIVWTKVFVIYGHDVLKVLNIAPAVGECNWPLKLVRFAFPFRHDVLKGILLLFFHDLCVHKYVHKATFERNCSLE